MTTVTDTTDIEFQRRLGRTYKKTSIIMGVIGMFILGIPLGIAAFIYARKAETQGVKATAGIVLAVMDIVLAIVFLVVLKPFNI
ncbi:UNVERIFIED_ORG: ABC-type dipeptide/oligopeptide/nickel transport system permease component [Paenarthrobacter nicotinovorans]